MQITKKRFLPVQAGHCFVIGFLGRGQFQGNVLWNLVLSPWLKGAQRPVASIQPFPRKQKAHFCDLHHSFAERRLLMSIMG